MSYGTIAATQKIAFGATNSDEDTRTTQAQTTATKFINATLNRTTDITTPSGQIDEACNLIAAAILTTSPEHTTENVWWKMGLKLLDYAKGDKETDAEWGYNYNVNKDSPDYPLINE